MKKALNCFFVFIFLLFIGTLVKSDIATPLSAESIKAEIIKNYGDNINKFRKDFVEEFLNWEVTTQEALARAHEVIELLLEIQVVSQEDFAWFAQILQKKGALIGA